MPRRRDRVGEFDHLLEQLYFRDRMMLGRDRLYKHIRAHKPNYVALGLSRRYVMEWLRRQEAHQLFFPVRRTGLLQPTVPKEPFATVALDLIDLASIEHRGYKWALTAVDLFSRKAYAVPLKSKEADEVVRGFAKMLYGNSVRLRIKKHTGDRYTITATLRRRR